MKPKEIPPNTPQNIAGAIGNVIRTSAAWASAVTAGQPSEVYHAQAFDAVVQLQAIIFQRYPTEEETSAVFPE